MLLDWHKVKTHRTMSIGRWCERVRRHMIDGGDWSDDAKIVDLIEGLVLADRELQVYSFPEKRALIRSIYCSLRKELEILHDYAADPDVSEIMVNGAQDIFIERNGQLSKIPLAFENVESLEKVIRRLAAHVGREMNDLHPIVDARLQDGSRINAVDRSIALGGPVLTIRKFNKNRMSMRDLIEQGDISEEAAEFLQDLVASGYNMFVSGGTSSGKTTFLNILSDFIPAGERIIVIEDSAELSIRSHDNIVRLEARTPNAQGKGEVSIRDLIRTSLRMRPDRIIVGEVRGAEVVDMLQAMSTGHDGSLSTGHANSAAGMVVRLETLFLTATGFPIEAIRNQIAGAIDVFVHLKRTRDGHRRVWSIAEVIGYRDGVVQIAELYGRPSGDELLASGNRLTHTEKLQQSGKEEKWL